MVMFDLLCVNPGIIARAHINAYRGAMDLPWLAVF
jgi:hypothetical protein